MFTVALLLLGMMVVTVFLSVVLSDPDAPAAQVVAAAIALVGVLATAVVSLIGIFVKQALDRRADLRAEQEAARRIAEYRDQENRLKLEAAIRAIQLFSTSSGAPTLPVQRAGAPHSQASVIIR